MKPIPGMQDGALMKKETPFVYSIMWFMASGAPWLNVRKKRKIYQYFLKMTLIEIYLL